MASFFPSEFRWGLLLQMDAPISWLTKKAILVLLINMITKNLDRNLVWWCIGAYIAEMIVSQAFAEAYNNLRLGGKAKKHLRTSMLNVNIQLTNR